MAFFASPPDTEREMDSLLFERGHILYFSYVTDFPVPYTAVTCAFLSSHTSLTPHFLESKHLGVRSMSFLASQLPALCWVESELNCPTSSKNDGTRDKNKHYRKTEVLKNPRRNDTKQDADTNNRVYVESICDHLACLYLVIFITWISF